MEGKALDPTLFCDREKTQRRMAEVYTKDKQSGVQEYKEDVITAGTKKFSFIPWQDVVSLADIFYQPWFDMAILSLLQAH